MRRQLARSASAYEKFDQEAEESLKETSDVVREFLRDYRRTMSGFACQLSINDAFIKSLSINN